MSDYTKKQIFEITGLPLRLVQFYTEEGLILPEEGTGTRRGDKRKYSKQSLIEFLLIKELQEYGIVLSKMKFVFTFIRNHPNIVEYSKLKLYEEGWKIFLFLYKEKNILNIYFKEMGGAKQKTAVLSIEDMEKYLSMVTIDFGRIVEKANQG